MDFKKLSGSIADFADKTGKKASETVSKSIRKMDVQKVGDVTASVAKGAQKIAYGATSAAKEGVAKSAGAVNKIMDVNGDGQVDIEDIIIMGLKIPGIGISRSEFLRSAFMKDFPKSIIDDAIDFNPAHAGIAVDKIDKYADEVIKFERNCVSGISAALSTPGGFAMAATIPADIAQYYGYMLRVAQKLLYLYGFPEIDVTEKGKKFDTETLNILTLCLGVMYGVAGANNALKSIAKALGAGVQKQLMKKALTKGTIYPIVKSTAKWFGVKMTKEVFTGFFKHAIPIAGGVIGGGITYLSFKPCCDKLKLSLQDTFLSNPNHRETDEENLIFQDEGNDDERTETFTK